jgi:hypothetical protein
MSARVAHSPPNLFRIALKEYLSAYSSTELDAQKIATLGMDL